MECVHGFKSRRLFLMSLVGLVQVGQAKLALRISHMLLLFTVALLEPFGGGQPCPNMQTAFTNRMPAIMA